MGYIYNARFFTGDTTHTIDKLLPQCLKNVLSKIKVSFIGGSNFSNSRIIFAGEEKQNCCARKVFVDYYLTRSFSVAQGAWIVNI